MFPFGVKLGPTSFALKRHNGNCQRVHINAEILETIKNRILGLEREALAQHKFISAGCHTPI